jgi:hypothetical protein
MIVMASGDDLRERFRSGPPGQWRSTSHEPALNPPTVTQPIIDNTSPIKPGRKKLYMALFFVFIGLVGIGAYYYFVMARNNPIPASVQSAVSLPLYYPEKLPEGYVLDDNSYTVSGEIVTFHAVNQQNRKLIFTIQPRPPTFDFPTFYQKGLSGTEQFTTPVGQAAIGKAQTKLIGNLVTEISWVIVSADTDKVSSDDLRLTLNNLRRAQ